MESPFFHRHMANAPAPLRGHPRLHGESRGAFFSHPFVQRKPCSALTKALEAAQLAAAVHGFEQTVMFPNRSHGWRTLPPRKSCECRIVVFVVARGWTWKHHNMTKRNVLAFERYSGRNCQGEPMTVAARISDSDISRVAVILVECYGNGALLEATFREVKATEEGRYEAASAWSRVADAVELLQRFDVSVTVQ